MITDLETGFKFESLSDYWSKFCRRLVHRQFDLITRGQLKVSEQGAETTFGGSTDSPELTASVAINHPSLYTQLVTRGTIGAAESFIDGHWRSDDLVAVVRVLLRNQSACVGLDGPWTKAAARIFDIQHWLRRNNKNGSRKNIAVHYDLGNEFFELFLDETLMYSCAIFDSPGVSLADASVRKLDHICRKLRLSANDHVLEIGTGWGSFAIHAAKNYGARVTTTTISEEQFNLAAQRIRTEGLEEKITLLKSDYRDLTGTYDKLVSIEMIEAVGQQYIPLFFQKCAGLLKPDGVMVIQAITAPDHGYTQSNDEVGFIKKYIFPGGFLPSISGMAEAAQRAANLRMVHLEDLTPHYALTMEHWRRKFLENLPRIRKLGMSEHFLRMWEFYMAYCEGAFHERAIGNVQIVCEK